MREWLGLAPLLLGGCLSHMAPDSDPRHLEIAWEPDFAAAADRARATGRLILLVMVGGDILDRC